MIEEEKFIIETADNDNDDLSQPKNPFPVKTQLTIIGVMLLVLFAGLIAPKTLALLNKSESGLTEVQAGLAVSNETGVLAPQKIDNVSVRAKSAFVWDVVGQRVLYQKNPDEVLPLASITKLMTALVTYELIPDNTLVTVSGAAAAQQSGGSFTAGESFKSKELADFALISSYNSAAYTLASSVGELLGEGDPVSQFVAAMNIKAEELELSTLSYTNPTGLDDSISKAGAYGSARDTSYLMEYIILNDPAILAPTVKEYSKIFNQRGQFHEAFNTNNILSDIPNLIGSKTGYTDLAGGNLTVAFDAGFNRPIVVTVLGSTISERFSDVNKLIAAVQESMVNKE